MLEPLYTRHALAIALMLGAVSPTFAQTTTAPDATLYTTYSVATDLETASWVVCGSTAESEGCFGSGTLGPFGHIGAMLEGQPAVNGSTVTREIYVLDTASGTAANGVTLYVYTKTDVVSSSDDQASTTLTQTVPLPLLVGGSTVTAYMAANSVNLYVGTNQSTSAVSIVKDQWTTRSIGGFSPPLTVGGITANAYGYVTVTFGAVGGEFSGFYVFGPTGAPEEDGGGAQFSLNNINAVVPAALPF